jgi:Zn-dependent peptidase ImmA (M78 family)
LNQITEILQRRRLSKADLVRVTGLPSDTFDGDFDPEALSAKNLGLIADALGVPQFALLRSVEANVRELPEDYRTTGNRSTLHTRSSLSAIYKTYDSTYLLDSLSNDIEFKRSKLKLFDQDASPVAVAAAIRSALRVSGDDIAQLEDPMSAFYLVRYQVERLGIFLFAERIADRAVRGFCLNTDVNRYIVVNAQNQSYRARIFTAIHELAHLHVGKPGIVDPIAARLPLERLCNSIAAEFLLPTKSIEKLLGGLPSDTRRDELETINTLYRRLPYSKFFIAIRLQELGDKYRGIVDRWLKTVGIDRARSSPPETANLADLNQSVNDLDEDTEEEVSASPAIRRTSAASYQSARLGFNAVQLAHAADATNIASRLDTQYALNLPAPDFDKVYKSYQKRLKEVRKNAPD